MLLLRQIEDEISASGGREVLMHRIIAEARDIFSRDVVINSVRILSLKSKSFGYTLLEEHKPVSYLKAPRKRVQRNNKKRIWTEADDNYILTNYGIVTYKNMAKVLECKPSQIVSHVNRKLKHRLFTNAA